MGTFCNCSMLTVRRIRAQNTSYTYLRHYFGAPSHRSGQTYYIKYKRIRIVTIPKIIDLLTRLYKVPIETRQLLLSKYMYT